VDAVCPGVELFNLSKELSGIPYITDAEWNASMIRVVEETRTRYGGPITWAPCALPWVLHDDDAYSRMIPLLQAVDILGLNAYPWPLTPVEDPTVANAAAAWKHVRQTVFDPLVTALAKPYIFTEVNGDSRAGFLRDGWGTDPAAPVDLGEQVVLYRSVIETFFADPRFFGAFWWSYPLTGALPQGSPGGREDPGSAFRLKPAQDEVERAYGDGSVTQRIVAIDGSVAEWRDEWLLGVDATGDCTRVGRPDVKGLYAVLDQRYLYLRVAFWNPLRKEDLGYPLFFVDIDQDGVPEYKITFAVGSSGSVVCVQYPFRTDKPSLGNGDGTFNGTDIELRVPTLFLEGIARDVGVSFGLHTVENRQLVWLDSYGYPSGGFYGPVKWVLPSGT
jgi:hypothetical protein